MSLDGNPRTVTDFFNQIKETGLTKIEIYNQVESLTSNFDLKKLEMLYMDFEMYLLIEKEERRAEFSLEQINEAIAKLNAKGEKAPYLLLPETFETIIGSKNVKIDKFLDLEKLLFPHEFFECNQFKKFLIKEIKKRKSQESSVKKETFDTLLPKAKCEYLLNMLERLGITINGIHKLSNRRKSAIRGVAEAAIEKSFFPQMSITSVYKLIADKIGLKITADLAESQTSREMRKKALQYMTSNPLT